jgi:hypothetical protein
MIPALRNLKTLLIALARRAVDQAMLTIDASGPPTLEITLQWLRFARSFEGMPAALLNEGIESL